MDSVFADHIDEFVVIYMDDLLVYCRSVDDHMVHVRKVLERLRGDHVYVVVS